MQFRWAGASLERVATRLELRYFVVQEIEKSITDHLSGDSGDGGDGLLKPKPGPGGMAQAVEGEGRSV